MADIPLQQRFVDALRLVSRISRAVSAEQLADLLLGPIYLPPGVEWFRSVASFGVCVRPRRRRWGRRARARASPCLTHPLLPPRRSLRGSKVSKETVLHAVSAAIAEGRAKAPVANNEKANSLWRIVSSPCC